MYSGPTQWWMNYRDPTHWSMWAWAHPIVDEVQVYNSSNRQLKGAGGPTWRWRRVVVPSRWTKYSGSNRWLRRRDCFTQCPAMLVDEVSRSQRRWMKGGGPCIFAYFDYLWGQHSLRSCSAGNKSLEDSVLSSLFLVRRCRRIQFYRVGGQGTAT